MNILGKTNHDKYKYTSSGEKKATASGSVEPAGCKDMTALNIDGNNNSTTATFSGASIPIDPSLRLLEPQ
jgi:hypothetical protein